MRRMALTSFGVSVKKALMQTTGLMPAFLTVWMWWTRLAQPFSTQATFSPLYSGGMGLPGTGMGAPPWH